MVAKRYVPERGDVVWVDFDPTRGHEQAKTRPALVLSPRSYNQKTNLALMCPITTKAKGYPFEVPLVAKQIEGVILGDQLRSLDWSVRNVRFIQKAPANALADVEEMLKILLLG